MARPTTKARIETYNLFGETADLPDVVHCESIASRSRLHDWAISPHRHPQLHQVLLIESGGAEAELDGRTLRLAPPSVANVPAGCVHGYVFERGSGGWVVTLAAEIMETILQDHEGLRPVLENLAILSASPALRELVPVVAREFAGRRFGRAHVLRSLCGLLLGLVAREMVEAGGVERRDAAAPLYRRFEALLEERLLDHWPVVRYAETLAVSPTHLSRVCRAATGMAASRVIEERLLREARRQLIYTNRTVAEVAYGLGFQDPAYFSRVFAKATGVSPRRFRAKREEGG